MNKSPAAIAAVLALFAIALPLCAWGDTPKKAASLSQVPGNIENTEGKSVYAQQMSGATLPDGFGTALPPGVTARDIVLLLLPNGDPGLATLVGLKRWPHAKDTYIALACIAPNQSTRESALKYNNGSQICAPWLGDSVTGISAANYTLALAVVKMPQSARPALASTVIKWSGTSGNPLGANWDHSNLDGPFDAAYPEELYKFDFAKYAISEDTTAFGIRSGINENYAGGGANFQILTLFAVINGELRVVFSEPIYYFKDIAGAWNENGTRNHEDYEGANIIIVSKTRENGYYKLLVKSSNKKWQKEFHWDKKSLRYVADE